MYTGNEAMCVVWMSHGSRVFRDFRKNYLKSQSSAFCSNFLFSHFYRDKAVSRQIILQVECSLKNFQEVILN